MIGIFSLDLQNVTKVKIKEKKLKVSPSTETIAAGMYPVVLLINDRSQTETKTIYIKVIGAAQEPKNCLDCTLVIINPGEGNIKDGVEE